MLKCQILFKTIIFFFEVPEEAQRKPRVRTPKVDKMKTDEEGGNKEAVTKGRKRKKSLKVDLNEASDVCGEAGPPTGELDPITATIEAVLATALNAAQVDKPKKAKRVKKQDQEGNEAKTQKQETETTTADAGGEENDDDSSTAGIQNSEFEYT